MMQNTRPSASKTKSFSVVNRTKAKTPRLPFTEIKNAILGTDYDLSLALITPKVARAVTLRTKKKDKASNVLSFPLSKQSGEILMCPATARRQAPEYGLDYRAFLARLFIHGCYHLAGYTHSATMEKLENQMLGTFGLLGSRQTQDTGL